MNNKLTDIGLRIRQARKDKHLSQAELADLMNISTPYISELETGKVNFSVDTLIKLTEALQVSADWLIQSENPAVHAIFDNEISELLSDCSPSQKQAIIRLIAEMKNTFHNSDI